MTKTQKTILFGAFLFGVLMLGDWLNSLSWPEPVLGACYESDVDASPGLFEREVLKVVYVDDNNVVALYTFPSLPEFKNKWSAGPGGHLSFYETKSFMQARRRTECPW